MKARSLWIPLTAVALGGAVLLSGCGRTGAGKAPVQAAKSSGAAQAETVTKTFEVTGMMCSGCEAAIKGSVKKVPGVTEADADFKKGEATVVYDPKKVSEDQIAKTIEKAGYKVAGEAAAGPAGAASTTRERP